jgi:hypothetical protein
VAGFFALAVNGFYDKLSFGNASRQSAICINTFVLFPQLIYQTQELFTNMLG